MDEFIEATAKAFQKMQEEIEQLSNVVIKQQESLAKIVYILKIITDKEKK